MGLGPLYFLLVPILFMCPVSHLKNVVYICVSFLCDILHDSCHFDCPPPFVTSRLFRLLIPVANWDQADEINGK